MGVFHISTKNSNPTSTETLIFQFEAPIHEGGLRITQLHNEELTFTFHAVFEYPTLMPVHLGLFARIELQGYENLPLAMGRLLDIPLNRAVMAFKAVFIPQTFINPHSCMFLFATGFFVLLKPGIDNMPYRLVLFLEMVPDAKGSERMLTVDHYELIRRKVEIDGETQRDVAKELVHSRKTVAKALKLRIPPGYQLTKPCPRPAAKLLAVQSQLAVCKQQIASKKHPRPRFTAGFRLLWVVLSKSLDKWEDLVHLMQPATVKKWHTTAFRYFWRWKSRRKGGRPPISKEMQDLIYKLSKENPLWSPERIRDTLVLLQYDPPCDDTIRKYMYKPRKPHKRSTTWLPFLRNHLDVS